MNSNVFTILKQMLSTITISGEENVAKMNGIFTVLRELEKAANKPEAEEGDKSGRADD